MTPLRGYKGRHAGMHPTANDTTADKGLAAPATTKQYKRVPSARWG